MREGALVSLYEKNLEVFKNFSPDLYVELQELEPLYPLKLESTDEQLNYRVSNQNAVCFLHSIYNIENEMKGLISHISQDAETLILFGLGCGYAINQIADSLPHIKMLMIVEPSLEIMKSTLSQIDIISTVSKIKSTAFILNKSPEDAVMVLADGLRLHINSKIEFAFHTAYRSLFSGYYEKVHDGLIKAITNSYVNLQTGYMTHHMYTYNTFKNLKMKTMRLESLIDNLEGNVGIIVGAGPSLNKNMQLLKAVNDRAIILAVGTGIRILDRNGIIPHLRLAFDGTVGELKIFEELDTKTVGLIYGTSLYHEILPDYEGPKFRMVVNMDQITKYLLNEMGQPFQEIRSGFSVSNVAVDLLNKMGCKKIIFLGQDLCYSEGSLYAKGSSNDDVIDFEQQGYRKVKDIYGEEAYTDAGFAGIRKLLEDWIREMPHIEFINATEGGVNLEGAKNVKFEEVLKQLPESANVQKILNQIYTGKMHTMDEQLFEKLKSTILGCEPIILEIMQINSDRLKRLKKLNSYRIKKIKTSGLMREYEEIEKNSNEKLKQIDFYTEVVFPKLGTYIRNMEVNYRYQGPDLDGKLESIEKRLLSETTMVHQYMDLLKQMVDDYK